MNNKTSLEEDIASAPSGINASITLTEQINAAITKLIRASEDFKDLNPGKDHLVSNREETIAMMQHYLKRLKLTEVVNSQLSIIHIAGTKGKGSTCAMVESILREKGYKTGMFTSPHLISPCERFRINGKPISENSFLMHFNDVWEKLEKSASEAGPYPVMAWFFRFLTLLGLHIFVHEKVDVAILEVGIGGRLDATNVVQNPVVCGVTTLDLDHTSVLGKSLSEIAYAKGGIFKRGIPAFTTTEQKPEAFEMLKQCASEVGTTVQAVPSLDAFGDKGVSLTLKMKGKYQRANAGLALAIANAWISKQEKVENAILEQEVGDQTSQRWEAILYNENIQRGLQNAFWPARSHSIYDSEFNMHYYVDGAHTRRSLECCGEWFHESIAASNASSALHEQTHEKALIFTIHHERNVASMLAPLQSLNFSRVYFCRTKSARPSLVKVPTFSQALDAAGYSDYLASKYSAEEISKLNTIDTEMPKLAWQETLAKIWTVLLDKYNEEQIDNDAKNCIVQVKPKLNDCINDLRMVKGVKWDILVTGSLYLAGEVLQFLNWQE